MTHPRNHAALVTAALALLLCAGLSLAASAQQPFVVIANRANPVSSLARDEAAKLFLMKRSRWSTGARAQPVDQVESSPVRRSFSAAIIGMDVPSVKSFWQEVVFSGKGDAPPERASDAEVIAFVASHPNALGYVSSVTRADAVKIITVTR